MKKLIFSTVFFLCIAGLASAQSDSRNTNTKSVSNITDAKRSSRHRSRAASASEKASATKSVLPGINNPTTVIPDNRTEYMQDGQLATYTGHQASPSNSDEFQSKKGRKKNTDKTKD